MWTLYKANRYIAIIELGAVEKEGWSSKQIMEWRGLAP